MKNPLWRRRWFGPERLPGMVDPTRAFADINGLQLYYAIGWGRRLP
jgi:hypothetical protein